MTFISNTEKRFGRGAAQGLVTLMRGMNLPEAYHGQFLEGTEANLLFLNKYGLVIRAGQNAFNLQHDLILKPLGAFNSFEDRSHAVIEIIPGVDGVIDSISDHNLLGECLWTDGIDFWDAQMANAGYIRYGEIPGLPNGIPVVVDRGAVKDKIFSDEWRKRHNPSGAGLRANFNHEALNGVQERLFQPYKSLLALAWPQQTSVNPEIMTAFLQSCEKAKKEGILSSNWGGTGRDEKSSKVVSAAESYSRSMNSGDRTYLGLPPPENRGPRTYSPL
jgi:hypothetical protein